MTCLQVSYTQDCFEADETIWKNTWSSCTMSTNPKSEYGLSHWIQYDMGEIRNMSKSWIWNCNDPVKLDQGFELVNIDYSIDGQNWTNWGEYSFPKAQGDAIYSGFEGPDLLGVKCQFVLITVISNHGEPNCAGIAEIKFNLLPGFEESIISNTELVDLKKSKYTLLPNPAVDIVYINGELKDKMQYSILNSYGMILQTGIIGINQNSIPVKELGTGIYFIKIENQIMRLIKAH